MKKVQNPPAWTQGGKDEKSAELIGLARGSSGAVKHKGNQNVSRKQLRGSPLQWATFGIPSERPGGNALAGVRPKDSARPVHMTAWGCLLLTK